MRITPLEIRQKNFEKKLRGYDKDEVSAFLISLSNEWERMLDESRELKLRLEQSERDVKKMREVESSLFKTLKTAEDTGANLIDQANKAAELHLRETQIQAEALLNESKSKAKAIIENAEQQAKEMIVEMQEAIKDLEKNYRQIENQRDNLVNELTNLAQDVKERVSRMSKLQKDFKVEDHLIKVRELVRESESQINKEKLSVVQPTLKPIPSISGASSEEGEKKLATYLGQKSNTTQPKAETIQKQIINPPKREKQTGGSFFDEIDE